MLKIVKGLNLCNKYKKFELSKKRPKVLLLGNGLFRDDCKWNDIIDKCSKSDFNDNFTDDVPYSIRANVKCDILDSVRQTKYKETLEKIFTDTLHTNKYLQGGYGIYNVCNRIKYFCKEEEGYGLFINSVVGQGTEVSIKIKMIEYDNGNS